MELLGGMEWLFSGPDSVIVFTLSCKFVSSFPAVPLTHCFLLLPNLSCTSRTVTSFLLLSFKLLAGALRQFNPTMSHSHLPPFPLLQWTSQLSSQTWKLKMIHGSALSIRPVVKPFGVCFSHLPPLLQTVLAGSS